MRDEVKILVHYLTERFNFGEPVVEIGSRQGSNQEGYADIRPFFPGKEFIGCDVQEGPGVDRLENAENLLFETDSLGTIIMLDTVEHIADPLTAMRQIHRCLKYSGILVVTTHHHFPYHGELAFGDYWRLTNMGIRDALLGIFSNKLIIFQGDVNLPHFIAGIASKDNNLDLKIDFNELNSLLPCPYPFKYNEYIG